MTETLIAGHSHTLCLGATGEVAPIVDGVLAIRGAATDNSYPERVAALARGRHLKLLWTGNDHLAKFLFKPETDFDFACSSAPDLAVRQGVDIVPEALVETTYAGAVILLNQIIILAKEAAAASITVAATPPPKGNDERLESLILKEPIFIDQLAKMGRKPEDVQLSDRWLRLKLWHLMIDVSRRTAAHQGADFLPIPKQCQDQDGFLKEYLWANDATHANRHYGQLFLEQIRSIQ